MRSFRAAFFKDLRNAILWLVLRFRAEGTSAQHETHRDDRDGLSLSPPAEAVEALPVRPCDLDHTGLRSFASKWLLRVHTMTEPETRLPKWLTIDLTVIVLSTIIIGVGLWIGLP